MASVPSSPETRPLPSESQRIPCLPRNDWQLLDNAAQKAVATVSMIDCLWEKLTKVSDDVELLQQRLPPPEPPEPPCRAEMEELMKVYGSLEESTKVQIRDLQHVVQQKLDDFSKELTDVKLAAEEKSSSAVSEISQDLLLLKGTVEDLLLLKGTVEAQEQRQNELQSSAEKLELSLSSLAERQMQEMARQEQNLNQVKQLLVDICDEAFNNLRRLEISVQTEAQLRQGDKQIALQQMDGFQQRLEALEGQQLKFSRSFEEMKRQLEVQNETRHRLDPELRELRAELGALQKQLESQQQSSACIEELEASIRRELRPLQQGLRAAKEQGPKLTEEMAISIGHLKEDMAISIGHLKEEMAEGLQELAARELTQRTSLEERSNALLDLGLQKLAKEVAERMDEVSERQQSAIVASESRLFAHFESWQSGVQEREAGREVQLKSAGEQLQRLESSCKEISALRACLDETRQSIEEGLAASAMNAVQGEMRLWAKMAQFGMPQ